jgi:ribonuclease E
MTKRMLIDATHAEETRVVVLDGNQLEDFDVETSTKKQLKGNIYLAKVVRVEPSLQAAFVEYGGGRHGFLAFGEIHPDYYQIPVADRQRLLDMHAEDARREEEAEDRAAEAAAGGSVSVSAEAVPVDPELHEVTAEDPATSVAEEPSNASASAIEAEGPAQAGIDPSSDQPEHHPAQQSAIAIETVSTESSISTEYGEPAQPAPIDTGFVAQHADERPDAAALDTETSAEVVEAVEATEHHDADRAEYGYAAVDPFPEPPPETVGGESDNGEDSREQRATPRFLRNYKIQEVIKRRQILLVQVVKEERGTKGAALTTYLSLAGRFCVLMPNSPRGGGISRKITSAADRRRLKDIITELEIPRGMGLIVRTAGANRPKPEIRRDCEYLLRLWDDIREHTLKSVAPALIYEEASLIKRAIRDVYSRDIDEIQVDGEPGWRAAHEFMRMLMPSHAKKVQLWRNGGQPLFAKYQVEAQLDGMLQPIVQLRSGGYLVINQTEALVAIDVNSGRSTRERGIEETALRTNLEAADEVARQLRLRDLAGLIVIDFIDMEAKKHNAMVERRLKEALKNDRARIQIGHISHFGLMEMSRQRLRPSLAETSFILCQHCGGTGHVRSTESAAIHVLRGIEEEGAKRRAAEIVVYASAPVALYILNHKRDRVGEIEARYAMRVICLGDEGQMASQFRIDRVKPQVAGEVSAVVTPDAYSPALPEPQAEADEEDVSAEADEEEADEAGEAGEIGEAAQAEGGETAEEAERRRPRRRRRRRGGRREESPTTTTEPAVPGDAMGSEAAGTEAVKAHIEGVPEHAEAVGEGADPGSPGDARVRSGDGDRLRRGRRGGRRRRPDGGDGAIPPHAAPGADQPDMAPVYSGPTPANPFGGDGFDIFDVMDRAEAIAAAPVRSAAPAEAPEAVAEPLAEPAPGATAMAGPLAVEPETGLSEPPAPAPETATDSRAEPEPLVKPIVIGADEAPVAEKKRGWWRR